MTRTKLVGIAVGVAVLTFLIGWLWGASGRSAAEHAQQRAEMALGLEEARTSILHGRVAIYNVNFGDASREFEEAKAALTRVRAQLNELGREEDGGRVATALAKLDEAQRQVNSLDQTANATAAEALQALDGIAFEEQ